MRLSRLPYATFHAVGKILYREVRRSDLVAMIIDKKFKPVHDRVGNRRIARLIRGIQDPVDQRQAAKVFLELFRLLHYLEYTDPALVPEGQLRDTILPFALITSETRLLLGYVEKRILKGGQVRRPLDEVYDSFVYCMPLELRKVVNTELSDISVTRQADNLRTRVENSHGILKDCFQQSIVQLAQAFDPEVDGARIFPDFTARREQSLRLRDGLVQVIRATRAFQAGPQRGDGAADEGGDLRLLRPLHQVPDVPRLVGLRAVLHRDPEVRQHAGAGADRAPLRDLPGDPAARGAEALAAAG